jgi:hypothetical protein
MKNESPKGNKIEIVGTSKLNPNKSKSLWTPALKKLKYLKAPRTNRFKSRQQKRMNFFVLGILDLNIKLVKK